jgi:hypothetical protein
MVKTSQMTDAMDDHALHLYRHRHAMLAGLNPAHGHTQADVAQPKGFVTGQAKGCHAKIVLEGRKAKDVRWLRLAAVPGVEFLRLIDPSKPKAQLVLEGAHGRQNKGHTQLQIPLIDEQTKGRTDLAPPP